MGQVHYTNVHQVEAKGEGVNLNALTQLHHFHYHGLGKVVDKNEVESCTSNESGSQFQLEDVAIRASLARHCPLGSPSVRHTLIVGGVVEINVIVRDEPQG